MRLALRGAVALGLLEATAQAQGLPPWVAPGRVPLEESARSAEILRRDEPLFVAPNPTSPRRGAAALGARLPLYGTEPGPGCRNDWFLVGAQAWVCSDFVRVSSEAPSNDAETSKRTADGLPRDYFFVGEEGALGYRTLGSADQSAPVAELQPGFAVSITDRGSNPRGEPFALTTKGLWLPLRDLKAVRPAVFHGYEVADGNLDRGWVVVDAAQVFAEPAGHRLDSPAKHRFDTVPVLETRDVKGHAWLRIGEGAWVSGADVRVPSLATPPEEARPGEHWLDVDLPRQVVTAYEGETPVYATLASTGVGKGDDVTATPIGVHRVWVKLRTTDMTNLEEADAERYYAIEDVPWVLFFKKGYGFHGAFWHRSFGHVRSHGCVNLTPLDAEHLFRWASPHLPAGWTAALPTEYDPGTLVRVR
jgi:lipoprotein-anchoring transpeptidase ErfK/SrfK